MSMFILAYPPICAFVSLQVLKLKFVIFVCAMRGTCPALFRHLDVSLNKRSYYTADDRVKIIV
jgi:hypothetical protein